MGDHVAAERSYRRVVNMDDRLPTSRESAALADGFRILEELRQQPLSRRRIDAALAALATCEAEHHYGFASQIRTRLVRLHNDLGDPSAALHYLGDTSRSVGRARAASTQRRESQRIYLEAAIAAQSESAAGGVERVRISAPAIDRALSRGDFFAELCRDFLLSLFDRRSLGGAAQLGPIVEYAVHAAAERTGTASRSSGNMWFPLARQIAALLDADAITYADADILTRTRVALRNPLSHGDLTNPSLREYENPIELFGVFHYVCSLLTGINSLEKPGR